MRGTRELTTPLFPPPPLPARLRLVKSIDNLQVTPQNIKARRSTCPERVVAAAAAAAAASLQQEEQENRHSGLTTGKDEAQWPLDAFFHSVWGGLLGAVSGKGEDPLPEPKPPVSLNCHPKVNPEPFF